MPPRTLRAALPAALYPRETGGTGAALLGPLLLPLESNQKLWSGHQIKQGLILPSRQSSHPTWFWGLSVTHPVTGHHSSTDGSI